MTYRKEDFLNDLDAIIAEPIYMGHSTDDLQQEIDTNMWWISTSADVLEALDVNEMLEFVVRLTEDRRRKVQQANSNRGMYFYMWFDDQAYQLRFNLISDMHESLPFEAALNVINTPLPIVGAFLTFYLTYAVPNPYVLDVYVTHLR